MSQQSSEHHSMTSTLTEVVVPPNYRVQRTVGVSHQACSRLWQMDGKSGMLGRMSKPALNVGDLSSEERLRLIEELWESLSEKPGAVPLTNAQRKELDRRLNDLERSGPEGIPW